MSNSSQPTGSQPEPSQLLHPLEGLHVLLAEDSEDQGRLYLHFLKQAGAEVTLVGNGQLAVDAVEKSSSLYNVVVMDFDMPEMDGVHATWKLHELCYNGTIIAITAHGSEELRESWYAAGCKDFLEKPLTKQVLVNSVMQQTAALKSR